MEAVKKKPCVKAVSETSKNKHAKRAIRERERAEPQIDLNEINKSGRGRRHCSREDEKKMRNKKTLRKKKGQ